MAAGRATDEPNVNGIAIDGIKHYYDFAKHLTTINTGAIVLISTFLEKQFKGSENNYLVAVSLISLVISLMACLCLMFCCANLIAREGTSKDANQILKASFVSWCATILFFLIGIITLVIFSLQN
jgi:hypothetical protein